MIIAFVSMEGLEMKKETEASLELLDVIATVNDQNLSVSNFMFFWTDEKVEIDYHKEKMRITWDDVPSMGAMCKGKYYAYPQENPFTE